MIANYDNKFLNGPRVCKYDLPAHVCMSDVTANTFTCQPDPPYTVTISDLILHLFVQSVRVNLYAFETQKKTC